MNHFIKIIHNTYLDSLHLMRVSSNISRLHGIEDAAILMGTEANIKMLVEIGFNLPELKPRQDDLLIVIKTADEKAMIALHLKRLNHNYLEIPPVQASNLR